MTLKNTGKESKESAEAMYVPRIIKDTFQKYKITLKTRDAYLQTLQKLVLCFSR